MVHACPEGNDECVVTCEGNSACQGITLVGPAELDAAGKGFRGVRVSAEAEVELTNLTITGGVAGNGDGAHNAAVGVSVRAAALTPATPTGLAGRRR